MDLDVVDLAAQLDRAEQLAKTARELAMTLGSPVGLARTRKTRFGLEMGEPINLNAYETDSDGPGS